MLDQNTNNNCIEMFLHTPDATNQITKVIIYIVLAR